MGEGLAAPVGTRERNLKLVLSAAICAAALYGVDHYYCAGTYFGGLQKMVESIFQHIR